MQRPYLPSLPVARNKNCPLCGEEDSASHILNACKHPEMKALYIERHNAAGRLILKEVLQGAKGHHQIIADIGSDEKMRGLGAFDNRLTNLLTDNDMTQPGLAPKIREKMRPDIMLVGRTKMNGKRRRPRAQTERSVVHIAEIGYTSEGRYLGKIAEKQEQHRQLERILQSKGYIVKALTVILGSTGGIFTQSMAGLASMGVDKERCVVLTRKLHTHSVRWLHTIIKKRRCLEQGKLFRRGRMKKLPDR